MIDSHLELQSAVALLERRVAALERQLGFDDTPPPPCAGAAKPVKPKASPNKRKKRTLNLCRPLEAASSTVEHAVDRCPDCGRGLSGGWACTSRQVVDIEPAPATVTNHVSIERYCGVCRKRVRPSAACSAAASGKRRIGHNLAALVASLHIGARVPLRVVQSLLAEQYRVHVSLGAMAGLLALVARKGEAAVASIREAVRQSPVVHADETGWRENGEYRCLWSLSTASERYCHIDERKTAEVALALIGDKSDRTLVTDYAASYNCIPGRHQRCWPHFKRALDKLGADNPGNDAVAEWIGAVLALWRQGREYRAFCLSDPLFGAGKFDRERKRKDLEGRLYALAEPFVDIGKDADPRSTLSNRIAGHLAEIFTFVEYPEVPDDNNAAERSVRHPVVCRRICGGTRSKNGTKVKAALFTLFGTWTARGLRHVEQCKMILALPDPAQAPA